MVSSIRTSTNKVFWRRCIASSVNGPWVLLTNAPGDQILHLSLKLIERGNLPRRHTVCQDKYPWSIIIKLETNEKSSFPCLSKLIGKTPWYLKQRKSSGNQRPVNATLFSDRWLFQRRRNNAHWINVWSSIAQTNSISNVVVRCKDI